jgi:hypothetical protein
LTVALDQSEIPDQTLASIEQATLPMLDQSESRLQFPPDLGWQENRSILWLNSNAKSDSLVFAAEATGQHETRTGFRSH